MPATNHKSSTVIWVTWALPGIHCYPNAPEDVEYLRHPHRHLFHFKASITVFHDDREIEFHQMKNWLTSLYSEGTLQLDYKSCEMLAQDLIDKILAHYDCGNRNVSVEVSEDGECGAIVTSTCTASNDQQEP